MERTHFSPEVTTKRARSRIVRLGGGPPGAGKPRSSAGHPPVSQEGKPVVSSPLAFLSHRTWLSPPLREPGRAALSAGTAKPPFELGRETLGAEKR